MEPTVHILLIEDNPADARLIREFLLFSEMQHYRLFHATSLAEGRQFLSEQVIDLILLDLYLPDSLGIKSIGRVMEEFSDYPIIVLTGLSDEQLGLQAVRRGAQDFLSKDELSQETLLRSIRYSLERHQMLHRLEQAQELAAIGNWKYEPEEDSLYCSRSAQKLLGIEPMEVDLSRGLADCLAYIMPEDQIRVRDAFQHTLESGEGFRVDVTIGNTEEAARHLNIQGRLEASDRRARPVIVGTLQDITDRKEREVLIRQKELAEQKARLKQEFLANTSHEIRTPLNAILQLSKMLLNENPRQEQIDYLNLIKIAGKTLLAVVNDVLDLSKIEAGKMDFSKTPFRMKPVLNSIIEMFELRAKELEIELEQQLAEDLPEVVIGDATRLTQIFINLVNNAIKYTEVGKVTISARRLKQEANTVWLEFSVKDTGIGIPADKLNLIFQSFQRLDTDLNRRQSGTGLGLTIVEQLVKRQEGSISVSSEEGKGTEFTFCLPFEETRLLPDSEKQEQKKDSNQLRGSRILLVEDNSLNQLVARKVLEDWGIGVTIAQHGKEAIERLKSDSFDLVLMDLQMPIMDGYETTRYIRSHFPSPVNQIPILALTANAFTGMDDECLRAGMNDYLSKPFETDNLFEKLVNNLKPKASPQMFTSVSSSHPPRRSTFDKVDLSYLKTISAGDDMIIKMAVGKYLEKTPELLAEMEEAFLQNQYEVLAQKAHKLKSSVATVGMEETRKDLSLMERLSREQRNLDQIPGLWATVLPEVRASLLELKTYLEKIAAGDPIR